MDKNTTGVVQLLEQAETQFGNTAKLLASYYHTLLEEKIPYDLACKMVIELQGRLMPKLEKD